MTRIQDLYCWALVQVSFSLAKVAQVVPSLVNILLFLVCPMSHQDSGVIHFTLHHSWYMHTLVLVTNIRYFCVCLFRINFWNGYLLWGQHTEDKAFVLHWGKWLIAQLYNLLLSIPVSLQLYKLMYDLSDPCEPITGLLLEPFPDRQNKFYVLATTPRRYMHPANTYMYL